TLAIIDKPMHEFVEPSQLCDGIGLISSPIDEMLVAVNDHPELRAPITNVIVADHTVANEPQRAAESVADHRRANVPHVHRLGDVRRGKIEDYRPRLRVGRDSQPLIVDSVVKLLD